MKIQSVKGTRDFYPEDMARRNWLVEAWRRVSLRNGFLEFDGPVLEYLDLFRIKSGQEIVSELFSFTDRGGRELALRPEITPTLARMVNERINTLPRPIKWFSIPRLFRAEKPQKGRLREFFQWNVDIIGSDDVLADAECIFTCVDFLREVGLTPQDVVVRIGSRPLTVAALRRAGVADSRMDSALAALDKRPRVSAEEFVKLATAGGVPAERLEDVCRFQDAADLSAVRRSLGEGEAVMGELERLDALTTYLRQLGAGDYCRLDMRMVRGLAYYTGIVYEVFDAGHSLRAIAGGGR
jgi:histidyl-tRNA synthetase